MQIFFGIFHQNSCFSYRLGSFLQKSQQSQERRGNNPLHRAEKSPQLPHHPFTAAQRNRAQRKVIHQPAENQPRQAVAPQHAVPDGQEKIKAQHRAQQRVQQILRQQIKPQALWVDQQPQHAKDIIQHTEGKAEAQAEQKQPGLFGKVQQIDHQRNTLPKKPPAVFGAVSW